MSEAFDQFAIVELFGHNIIAGRVTEQMIGGQGFIRVDVPPTITREGFTKFYGPGAVYCMTPCDEKTMLAAVNGLNHTAIELWRLNLPALQLSTTSEDEGSDDGPSQDGPADDPEVFHGDERDSHEDLS